MLDSILAQSREGGWAELIVPAIVVIFWILSALGGAKKTRQKREQEGSPPDADLQQAIERERERLREQAERQGGARRQAPQSGSQVPQRRTAGGAPPDAEWERYRQEIRQRQGDAAVTLPTPDPRRRTVPAPPKQPSTPQRRTSERPKPLPPKRAQQRPMPPRPPQQRPVARPVPQRPSPPARRPAPPPVPGWSDEPQVPTMRDASAPVAVATRPAHPRSIDAGALRRWLNPATLRQQFILTEVLQRPVALRPTHLSD